MKGKTLLVLRHGKSDWATGLEDFYRPLVSRGRLGSRKMGAWIRHQDMLPDTVREFAGRAGADDRGTRLQGDGHFAGHGALGRAALRDLGR